MTNDELRELDKLAAKINDLIKHCARNPAPSKPKEIPMRIHTCPNESRTENYEIASALNPAPRYARPMFPRGSFTCMRPRNGGIWATIRRVVLFWV